MRRGVETLRADIDREIEDFTKEILEKGTHEGFTVIPVHPPWNTFSRGGYLVRNEKPERVLEAVFNGDPISIRNKDASGNACLASDAGITSAFEWGHNGSAVRMVYGFDREAVAEDSIARSEDDVRDIRDVVSVHGTVSREHIRFVLLRVPRRAFPEELLTEKDEEHGAPAEFVYRALIPAPAQEKRTAPH